MHLPKMLGTKVEKAKIILVVYHRSPQNKVILNFFFASRKAGSALTFKDLGVSVMTSFFLLRW